MRASEVVAALQRIIEEKGDLPVGFRDLEYGGYCLLTNVDAARTGVSVDDEALAPDFIAIGDIPHSEVVRRAVVHLLRSTAFDHWSWSDGSFVQQYRDLLERVGIRSLDDAKAWLEVQPTS